MLPIRKVPIKYERVNFVKFVCVHQWLNLCYGWLFFLNFCFVSVFLSTSCCLWSCKAISGFQATL